MQDIYKRTIVKDELYSDILQQPRPLRIFLPPGYNELTSYPVVYCQDGEQFFNFGRIATHANQLILEENMEPMIIVGVDVDVKNRTDDYAPTGERFSAYCQFFILEMLPYIEERYAVRTKADGRILAGDSLGGTVSLHLALDYPHLFQQVLSLSGAFLSSTNERIAREPNLSWLHMYMLIGLQETAVKTDRGTFDFLEANRQTRLLLEERQVQLQYEEKPGEHLWGFWQRELPHAMKQFFMI